jgi:hypothetical protein
MDVTKYSERIGGYGQFDVSIDAYVDDDPIVL